MVASKINEFLKKKNTKNKQDIVRFFYNVLYNEVLSQKKAS